MVLGAHYLGRYYPALTIVLRVLSVAVIIYLVNKSGSATTKTYDKLDTNKDGIVSEAERAAAQVDLSSLLLNSVAGIESEE